MQAMNEARAQQAKEKQERLKREALLEKAEFERVVKKMAEDEQKDLENEKKYKEKLLAHKGDLTAQIGSNHEVKTRQQQD